jgi:hypothetical protein
MEQKEGMTVFVVKTKPNFKDRQQGITTLPAAA